MNNYIIFEGFVFAIITYILIWKAKNEEAAMINSILVLIAYFAVAYFTNGTGSFYLSVMEMNAETLKGFLINSAIILVLTGLASFSEEIKGTSFVYGIVFVAINGYIFGGTLGLLPFFVMFGIMSIIDNFSLSDK